MNMPGLRTINWQRLKRPAQLILTGIVFYLLGRFIVINWADFKVILAIKWNQVLFLLVAEVGFTFFGSARFTLIYRRLGADINYLESYGLYLASGVVNMLLPAQSGAAVKAVYLKNRYKIPYSQTPAMLLGGLAITFATGGFTMLALNIYYTALGSPPPSLLWWAATAFSLMLISLWVPAPRMLTSGLGRIGNMMDLFFDGIRLLRSSIVTMLMMVGFQLFEFFFAGLAWVIAFHALGVTNFNVLAGLTFAVFGALFNTVFLTPGNVGLLEAAAGYASGLYGLSAVQGIGATVLIHVIGYIFYFVSGPIIFYMFFNHSSPDLKR